MEFAVSYSYIPSLIDRSTMPREAYLELIDYISYNPPLSPAPGFTSLPPVAQYQLQQPPSYMPYYPPVPQYQPQLPPSYTPYYPQVVPQVFIPMYYPIILVAEERSDDYEDLLDLQEQMGRVNVGLSEETIIKNLKTSPVDVASKDKDEEGGEICAVCQDEYKLNETVGTLQCGHRYHAHCIKEWLLQKNVCPVCKAKALIIP